MAPEALAWILGEAHKTATGYGVTGCAGALGSRKGSRWCWGGGRGGPEATPSLPHVSLDVVQAERHALVCAAPLGLFLALPASAQLVLKDLGGGRARGRAGTPTGPAPRTAPYLVGVVEELQHCENAGPDEQPHLAPDITCGCEG